MVQRIGGLWTSAQRLRAELALVSQQYPVKYSTRPLAQVPTKGKSREEVELVASTTILLASIKSKVNLRFVVGGDCLARFPGGLGDVGIEVGVVYGNPEYVLFSTSHQITFHLDPVILWQIEVSSTLSILGPHPSRADTPGLFFTPTGLRLIDADAQCPPHQARRRRNDSYSL